MDKKDQLRDVTIALSLMLVLALGCGLSGQPIGVTISEIGTCHDYNKTTQKPIDIATQFAPDVDQITVYFYAETNTQADATYRWWFGDELIAEYDAPLVQGYNFGWVTPKDLFPEGEYRVDILLGPVTLRSTSFRVAW